MSLEELAEQVSGQLWTLKLNELKEVCLRAKVDYRNAATSGRIKQLEAQLENSNKTHQGVSATYADPVSTRRHSKLQALIGKKCLVDCCFEGVPTKALWDTGSQVTIINESWRSTYLPHVVTRDLQELLEEDETLVGQLQPVKAIYPANAQPLQTQNDSVNPVQHQNKELWDPPVALDHLTPEQQDKVRAVLREECHAFSKGDQDVGCIPSLKLKIRLKDTTPVTRTYTSVPKPLHKEVKEYLEDLLNRGWIQKSRSPYSSPLVCVRKKDGTLRLKTIKHKTKLLTAQTSTNEALTK
ncbi:hypothetical protein WMY93_000126 [Mugilogobius chulae]|uniref:Uncharacterized protein n=1 Tax=Mugilogobius chulae TaxID=88201 RepID=A0AAW0Q012_9GOBI